MAEKTKTTWLVITLLSIIFLPIIGIAWNGGGPITKVEVRSENNEADIVSHKRDDKTNMAIVTAGIKANAEDISEAKLRDLRIENHYSAIKIYMKTEAKKTDKLVEDVEKQGEKQQQVHIEITKIQGKMDNWEADNAVRP